MEIIIIILLIVIAGLVYFIVKTTFAPEGGDAAAKAAQGEKGELIHDNIMIKDDLKEFSDDVLARIDTRMTALRKLVKEADDRIASLENLMSENDRKEAPRQRAREEAEEQAARNSRPPAGGMDRRATILHLARKGLKPEEIAKQIGTGRAEIELILNVENNRKK